MKLQSLKNKVFEFSLSRVQINFLSTLLTVSEMSSLLMDELYGAVGGVSSQGETVSTDGSDNSSECNGLAYFSRLCETVLLECCFTSTETVGLLVTGAQDGHLDFHKAPELCLCSGGQCL